MNPHTIEGMKQAKKNGNEVALYTNGRLLNKKHIDDLINIDPLFIRISIYGGDEQAHANYTQNKHDRNSFKKVLENVSNLLIEKEQKKSNINIGLSYLLHPLTITTLEDFAQEIINMKGAEQINYVRFTPAVDYFTGQQHSKQLMNAAYSLIDEKITPLLEEKGVKSRPYYHRLNDLHAKKDYTNCRASGWFGEIGPGGDVYLCCEKLFIPEYKIGNLKEQTLDEIWTSELRQEIITNINQNDCKECPTLCKPHELNKIFSKIEYKRKNGKIDEVKKWANDFSAMAKDTKYCPSRLEDFQS